MKYVIYLLALSAASCASHYVPTNDRYFGELETLLHKHEDTAIVHYGPPDNVIELSEGTKLLVYNKLPYRGAPLLNDQIKQHTCRTIFHVDEALVIQFIKSEGNFCVK